MNEELDSALKAGMKADLASPKNIEGVNAALKTIKHLIEGVARISSDEELTWGLFIFAVDLDEKTARKTGNDIAKLLLKKGLDPRAKYKKDSPLNLAKDAENTEIVEHIEKLLAAQHRAPDSPMLDQSRSLSPKDAKAAQTERLQNSRK